MMSATMNPTENLEAPRRTVYCQRCGTPMKPEDRFCRSCGHDATAAWSPGFQDAPASNKNRTAALLLCVFLGFLGIHRFYAGRIGTGLLWLLTLGFLGVGVLVDLILILAGEFRDSENRRVLTW